MILFRQLLGLRSATAVAERRLSDRERFIVDIARRLARVEVEVEIANRRAKGTQP